MVPVLLSFRLLPGKVVYHCVLHQIPIQNTILMNATCAIYKSGFPTSIWGDRFIAYIALPYNG